MEKLKKAISRKNWVPGEEIRIPVRNGSVEHAPYTIAAPY